MSRSNKAIPRTPIIIYCSTLVIFLIASFIPEHRLWGINFWAFYPTGVSLALFVFGLMIGPIAWYGLKRISSEQLDQNLDGTGNPTFLIVGLILSAVFTALFVIFSVKTHFLGDGYQLMAYLTTGNTPVKYHNFGEFQIHQWLYRLLEGEPEAKALLTYRIVSVIAGLVYLAALTLLTMRLFIQTASRVIFWFGMATGGWMLLYFGYVENYSLFVATVGIYTLTGLLVSQGEIGRWVVLPMVGAALLFHVFAVALIPSAIYLLLTGEKTRRWLAVIPKTMRLPLIIVPIASLAVIFIYFYATSDFFRFSILPLTNSRFAVDGYTLFSTAHLVDIPNLLLLLLPGLLLVSCLFRGRLSDLWRQPDIRFLTVLLVSSVGLVFLVDPRLGMARDWDLLSFCSLPLAAGFYFVLLRSNKETIRRRFIAVLAIALSALMLGPRIGSQIKPEISIAHLNNYFALDRTRNNFARTLLSDYYMQTGQPDLARAEAEKRARDFPEERLIEQARQLFAQNRSGEALRSLYRALELNPAHYPANKGLGLCYNDLGYPDSAVVYLKIAYGLNPNEKEVTFTLGRACLTLRRCDEAKMFCNRTLDLDSTLSAARYLLALSYRCLGDEENYLSNLAEVAFKKDVPSQTARELGMAYLKQKEYELAANAF
ncbi:MAG: hypothetical protein KAT79_02880, partial [candidate division Zixibacteria bacterium]|nr:hypothetical protein [candidate division Zixibacteria bacterium]